MPWVIRSHTSVLGGSRRASPPTTNGSTRRWSRPSERNEPDVTAFLAYGEADGSEITNIHVYADQVVLDQHMRFLGDQMGLMPGDLSAALESLEQVRVEVYGTPTGAAA